MTECAWGVRCASYNPATKVAGEAIEGCPLCAACVDQAAADIAALPGDYRDLEQGLIPAERGMSRRVATDEPGDVPLNLEVEALQRSIFWALTVWEPPVREAAQLTRERTRGVRDAWAVEHAAAVIAPRVALLAALETIWGWADGPEAGPVARDGLDAVRTLRALHRQARHVTGITRVVHELPGECSGCGASALRRPDGSDTVHCALCARSWAVDDYRKYIRLILEAK